ncbi:hypothetical protein FPHYL_9667 [Fusarium phyllophilum]|uniref:Uncharacterized protein n=1 Tax=Fusarium phyllophilum TaxID=47803 RepID=A0A8H5N2Q5_9HYPO|nr:hypothetical protein FPHYL_9667 [Fusarium phyllophilum]
MTSLCFSLCFPLSTPASAKLPFLSSYANGTVAKNVSSRPLRDLLFIFSGTLLFDGTLKGWTLDIFGLCTIMIPIQLNRGPESLAALADAAEKDLQVFGFLSTHVCHRIRLGCEDAIAVLILAWCTRLTHLSLTIPSFYPESRQQFMPLLYVKEAVSRYLDGPAEMASQLPLGQVRHVTLQPWNNEEVFVMAYARSFLHLPYIQTFCAYGLIDDLESELDNEDNELPLTYRDDYELPFPVSTSPIIELTIVGCLRSGVPDFITACRLLTKLNVRVDHELDMYGFPDQRELAEAVLKHKDSLEELDLHISIPKFPNPDPFLEETYSQMSRIQNLAVHIVDFFEGSWSTVGENCIKVVLNRIPKDIQVLKSRSQTFIDSWVSSSNNVFLEPYLEGIIELLEEAGPRGRFSKLRVLDLSEAFVDDPIMFDIRRIKQLATSRGVKLLLHD